MSDFIIDPQRGPHIRDYSDQSQDRVVICSAENYWSKSGYGYTYRQMAGVFTREEAYKLAGHCGEDRQCEFHDVPADHVPTLQAEVERLREVLEEVRIRACFIGHPGEAFYDRGDGVMVPDWRDVLQQLEAALAAHQRKKEGE